MGFPTVFQAVQNFWDHNSKILLIKFTKNEKTNEKLERKIQTKKHEQKLERKIQTQNANEKFEQKIRNEKLVTHDSLQAMAYTDSIKLAKSGPSGPGSLRAPR